RPRPTAWNTSTAISPAVTAARPGAQAALRPITTTAASRTTASRYQGRALDPGSHTRSPLTAIVCTPSRGFGGAPREISIVTAHSGITVWRLPGLACTGGGLVASIQ